MKKMKANVKKLLALILAMTMVLSLAAPAMAASYKPSDLDTVFVGYATPSNVATASNLYVTRIAAEGTNGGFEVYGFKKDTKYDVENDNVEDELLAGNCNVTDESTWPTFVKVELTSASETRIGFLKSDATYTVSAKNNPGAKLEVTVPNTAQEKNKILELKESAWTKIAADMCYFDNGKTGAGKKDYQVEGYIYQEKQPDGKWVPYYKLAAVDKDNNFVSNEWKYFVGEAGAKIQDAAAAATALRSAKEWDENNDVKKIDDIDIVAANAAAEVKVIPQVETEYKFTVINAQDVTVSSEITDCQVAQDKTTGSFQVSIKNVTESTKENKDIFVTAQADAQAVIEKKLAGSKKVTVESVVAATGNYFTVTVKKVDGADPVKDGFVKNVMKYGDDVATLIDTSKDGFYNAGNEQGSNGVAINAGAEVLGPVAVKKSDVPKDVSVATSTDLVLVNNNFYIAYSIDALKSAVTATSCKEDKSIPYTQLKMNYIIDGKKNGLVKVGELEYEKSVKFVTATEEQLSDAVTKATKTVYQVIPGDDWFEHLSNTANASFLKKDSLKVEKKKHATLVEKTETAPATCKKAGTKTIKTVCPVCNEVVSEKTEEVPAVTDPVEKNTVTEKVNGKDVEKVAFGKNDQKGKAPYHHTTDHWIEIADTKTTISADKKQTIKTTTYTCNLGEVHDELTKVETIDKVDLQHSGRWNIFNLEQMTALEQYQVKKGTNQLGVLGVIKSVTVADSDVDFETLPMNRKKVDIPATNLADTDNDGDVQFKFDLTKLTGGNTDNTYTQDQGIVLNNVYASSTALPTTKAYAAKLTIKDIVTPAYDCQEGSCVVVVDVYEVKFAKNDTVTSTAAKATISNTNLEQNLKDGKVTLLKSYTEKVTMPATQKHVYSTANGVSDVCINCGAKKEVAADLKFTATAKDLVYTGKAAQPVVVVTDVNGFTLIEGSDYLVSKVTVTEIGSYELTVKGLDAYAGNRIKVPFKIVAAPAPAKPTAKAKKQVLKLSLKDKGKNITAKKLKKKAQKTTIKVTGAKTALSYKTSNKKIATVNAKGVVTFKKGVKKGKSVKITVTAKKTTKFLKATKTITIKVK